MIDVVDPNAVPPEVRSKAIQFGAKIPRDYDTGGGVGYLLRMNYCYRLLSIYARRAKVIITSRIHVGLPATALGIPVMFVEKGNWLPGGKQSAGRVEGLLEIFHRVNLPLGQTWTFGDLSDEVPLPPGKNLADRYRAAFWNRLQRESSFFADTAHLFGMVPFQRLARSLLRDDLQDTFHFIMNNNLDGDLAEWHTKRAIEHIFYFHPNAIVYVHAKNDTLKGVSGSVLQTLVESGYNLVIKLFDAETLAKEL
jgi:hypothetical protein